MKLKIISYSATKGGAAKAARNFLNLMAENPEYESSLITVFGKLSGSACIKASKLSILWHFNKMLVSRFFTYFNRYDNVVKYSLNIFSSNYVKKELELFSKKKEILHINWINNDTISLFDMNKIFRNANKKVLLTLHDEWFYCSTEHYADIKSTSFVEGYKTKDGLISKLIFDVKRGINFENIVLTVPSQWMYERAKQSYLLKDADIHILPNVIDTSVYDYSETIRRNRYDKLEVKPCSFIVGFGAVSGTANPLKGFDLLIESLTLLTKSTSKKNNIVLLTFGSDSVDKRVEAIGFKVINMGFISSPERMAEVYNLLDVMIVPSRAESFGQVAAESLACQTPVIAFNFSGVRDIITHRKSGLMAEPFSIISLTENIQYMMDLNIDERNKYGIFGRKEVVTKFGKKVVLDKYLQLLDYVKGIKND